MSESTPRTFLDVFADALEHVDSIPTGGSFTEWWKRDEALRQEFAAFGYDSTAPGPEFLALYGGDEELEGAFVIAREPISRERFLGGLASWVCRDLLSQVSTLGSIGNIGHIVRLHGPAIVPPLMALLRAADASLRTKHRRYMVNGIDATGGGGEGEVAPPSLFAAIDDPSDPLTRYDDAVRQPECAADDEGATPILEAQFYDEACELSEFFEAAEKRAATARRGDA